MQFIRHLIVARVTTVYNVAVVKIGCNINKCYYILSYRTTAYMTEIKKMNNKRLCAQ